MEFEWEEEPQERKGELKIGSFSLSLLRRDIRLWGLALYKKWVWIVLVPPLAGGVRGEHDSAARGAGLSENRGRGRRVQAAFE